MLKCIPFLSKSNPHLRALFLKNTIRRGKNSITFKITSKLLNGSKTSRQFWYMEDIFKDKGRCDIYVPKTYNSSLRAIGHYNFLVTWAWSIGVKMLRFGCHMVCDIGVYL